MLITDYSTICLIICPLLIYYSCGRNFWFERIDINNFNEFDEDNNLSPMTNEQVTAANNEVYTICYL